MQALYASQKKAQHRRARSFSRVEDELQLKQKVANYRLEKLRQKREKEELSSLQEKPQICSKSRILGKQAEERFFEGIQKENNEKSDFDSVSLLNSEPNDSSMVLHSLDTRYKRFPLYANFQEPVQETQFYLKEDPFFIPEPSEISQKPLKFKGKTDKIFQYSSLNRDRNTGYSHRHKGKKTIPKRPSSAQRKTPQEHPSLLGNENNCNPHTEPSICIFNMNVLERNQYWLERKQQKIQKEKEKMNADLMKECTFEPVFYTRVPQIYQKYTRNNLKETINTRGDLDSTFKDNCSLSPFQVKVAFNSGCDIKELQNRSDFLL